MKLVVLIGLITLIVFFGGCLSESQIQREIEEANYCSVDDDCTVAYFGCPFGCGSYVNKDSVGHLKGLVENYQATNLQCEYQCMTPALPTCSEGKCVERICELDKEYNELSGSELDGIYYRPCTCPPDSFLEIAENKFKCVSQNEE